MALTSSKIRDAFCGVLLIGYGPLSVQSLLVTCYLIVVALGFVMFQMSILHWYASYTLPVKCWLGLSATGLALSTALTAAYYFLMLSSNKVVPDNKLLRLAFDFPRFWLALVAAFFYSHLTVSILFIYLYTRPYPDYAAALDQGLSTFGPLGFVERSLVDFLKTCQISFQLQFFLLAIEYILYAKKEHFQEWRQQQTSGYEKPRMNSSQRL